MHIKGSRSSRHQPRQRCRHILSQKTAVRARVSDELFLVQALCIIQGLLCCKAQQAVGIPLERSEVIERRWIFGLFLARDFLDRGHHLLSALRKQLFRVRFFRNAAA